MTQRDFFFKVKKIAMMGKTRDNEKILETRKQENWNLNQYLEHLRINLKAVGILPTLGSGKCDPPSLAKDCEVYFWNWSLDWGLLGTIEV